MALLDLLGQRWVLRIVWELRNGPMTSRALRQATGDISPTVLQARVDTLRGGLILELGREGYQLTKLGEGLLESFAPLYRYAAIWARALEGDPP